MLFGELKQFNRSRQAALFLQARKVNGNLFQLKRSAFLGISNVVHFRCHPNIGGRRMSCSFSNKACPILKESRGCPGWLSVPDEKAFASALCPCF